MTTTCSKRSPSSKGLGGRTGPLHIPNELDGGYNDGDLLGSGKWRRQARMPC
jgi:hypothetical protein